MLGSPCLQPPHPPPSPPALVIPRPAHPAPMKFFTALFRHSAASRDSALADAEPKQPLPRGRRIRHDSILSARNHSFAAANGQPHHGDAGCDEEEDMVPGLPSMVSSVASTSRSSSQERYHVMSTPSHPAPNFHHHAQYQSPPPQCHHHHVSAGAGGDIRPVDVVSVHPVRIMMQREEMLMLQQQQLEKEHARLVRRPSRVLMTTVPLVAIDSDVEEGEGGDDAPAGVVGAAATSAVAPVAINAPINAPASSRRKSRRLSVASGAPPRPPPLDFSKRPITPTLLSPTATTTLVCSPNGSPSSRVTTPSALSRAFQYSCDSSPCHRRPSAASNLLDDDNDEAAMAEMAARRRMIKMQRRHTATAVYMLPRAPPVLSTPVVHAHHAVDGIVAHGDINTQSVQVSPPPQPGRRSSASDSSLPMHTLNSLRLHRSTSAVDASTQLVAARWCEVHEDDRVHIW